MCLVGNKKGEISFQKLNFPLILFHEISLFMCMCCVCVCAKIVMDLTHTWLKFIQEIFLNSSFFFFFITAADVKTSRVRLLTNSREKKTDTRGNERKNLREIRERQ